MSTPVSIVPKLIDRKRKHMERSLSDSQRDALLMDEAKEDKIFRKEMADAMKASAELFAGALQNVSGSMVQISNSLSRSMELFAQSLHSQQAPYQHQQQNFQRPFPSGSMFQNNQARQNQNMYYRYEDA